MESLAIVTSGGAEMQQAKTSRAEIISITSISY